MKKKKLGLIIATLAVVGIGGLSLTLSIAKMKGTVQSELSSNTEMEMVTETEKMETEIAENRSFASKKDESIVLFKTASNSKINDMVSASLKYERQLVAGEDGLLKNAEKSAESIYDYNDVTMASFMYEGQRVTIVDGLLEKEIGLENAEKIMDFIYDYVDKTIFEPYEIDKTEYRYKIRRQYRMQDGVNYGVFLLQEDDIVCTIGIRLEEEPVLRSFARDGLIELAGGEIEIPEEYLQTNWCDTTTKREAIYNEYLDKSKEIIKMLGLQPIIEEVKDVDSISYFDVGDSWSTVTFGYVLEDGLYVKVFYNRVNQMWDGFSIAGYHQDYVDIAE